MLDNVIEELQPQSGQSFIDCTLGGAGYTIALAKKVAPNGKVIAFDLDDLAIKNAEEKIKSSGLSNILLVQENFRNLKQAISEKLGEDFLFDGIVMDLGLSSAQLDDLGRGFSFVGDRPLDMAFNQSGHTAVATTTIINRYPLDRLTFIFREYGQEPKAYLAAKKIIEKRKKNWIKTTAELQEILSEVIRPNPKIKINPLTRIFQALRMETNQELEALREVLPQAISLLKKGGKIVVVSFHSGEDKIVKNFFRNESLDCLCPTSVPVCVCRHQASLKILTKKPISASELEINQNPRSRSARMRVAQKI